MFAALPARYSRRVVRRTVRYSGAAFGYRIQVRLPSVPGPRAVAAYVDQALDQALGLLPRATALVTRAETLLADVRRLLERIESTRADAGFVIAAADETRARADVVLGALTGPVQRLLPALERLAATTDPREVDALVGLVDRLPLIADRLETDVLPMLQTLQSVAPDLHDLLDVSRELNEMLAKLPGMGRIKRKIDEEQELEGVTPPAGP
jgi:hypothetical protein